MQHEVVSSMRERNPDRYLRDWDCTGKSWDPGPNAIIQTLQRVAPFLARWEGSVQSSLSKRCDVKLEGAVM